jgi:hypothetical protein
MKITLLSIYNFRENQRGKCHTFLLSENGIICVCVCVYVCVCVRARARAMKQFDVLKVENTLADSVYYFIWYTICYIVSAVRRRLNKNAFYN